MSDAPLVTVIAYSRIVNLPIEPTLWSEVRRLNQDEGTDLERLVEFAGRTCYDSYGRGRSSPEYHAHIRESGHGSVLEHASLSFLITGISRGCSHEWVRHHAGVAQTQAGCAVSQRSTRFVNEEESDWAWHPLVAGNVEPRVPEEVTNAARIAYQIIFNQVYHALTARGVAAITARKQARGAARGALGNALTTAMVWTCNLRALCNVIEQRATEHADGEIRLLANRIYEAALPYAPVILSVYRRYEHPDMCGIGYGLTTEHPKL